MHDDGAAQGEQPPSPGQEPTEVNRPSPGRSLTTWWHRILGRLREQPRLLDALVILLVVVSTVASLGTIRPGWEYAAFGLAAAAMLWWRRTHPLLTLTVTVALTVACTLVTGTPGEASLATACALYAVLTVRAPRPAWLGLLVATAVLTTAMLLWGNPAALVAPTLGDLTVLGRVEYLLVTMITTVALWCVALMIGTSVRAKRLGLIPPVEEDLRKRGPIRRFLRRRPWTADLLVVLVFLGINLISTATIAADSAYLSIMAACAVALMWRRHRPLSVLTALTLLGLISILLLGHSGSVELGVAAALYTVVTVRGTRYGWVALVGTSAVFIAALLLWGTTEVAESTASVSVSVNRTTYVSTVAASQLIMWLIAVAIGMNVQGRREQIARLVDQARQYRLERDQRELLAAASERARITREMHDVVAHSLSVMVALADGAHASLHKSPERTDTALSELSRTGRSALGDMRRILGVLRSEPTEAEAELTPQPGTPALEDLIERFRATGMEVAFARSGRPLPEDAALQMTVYRIVQEGLTNVLRHAPEAPGIEVRLEHREGHVMLSVHNGRPARPQEPRTGSGQGLIGMRQRAATYDGTVQAGEHDGGWLMRADLYFSETEDAPAHRPHRARPTGQDETGER